MDWYRTRSYNHFDRPVGKPKATEIVTDPEAVAQHGFHPFLKRSDRTHRYRSFLNPKYNDDTKRHDQGEVTKKTRRICYASHVDSHIYAYYSYLLSQRYEQHLDMREYDESVVAYRALKDGDGRGKSNIHFARDVFRFIRTRARDEPDTPWMAMAFDVKGFFDNLNHRLLKQEWADLLGADRLPEDHYAVYRSLTRYAYVRERTLEKTFGEFFSKPWNERRKCRICTPKEFREKIRDEGHLIVHRDDRGIPQGTPISALLSNVYMRPFDAIVHGAVDAVGGLYRRYSDDLIVVVPEEYAAQFRTLVRKRLSRRKLRLQMKKTERFLFWIEGDRIRCEQQYDPHRDQPKNPDAKENNQLQYLGFVFDGEHVRIRPTSLTRFYRRMRAAVKSAAHRAKESPLPDTAQKKGTSPHRIRREGLYALFSHLGPKRKPRKYRDDHDGQTQQRGNFITYAHRAARIMKDVTGRDDISPQVANHVEVLHEYLDYHEEQVEDEVT